MCHNRVNWRRYTHSVWLLLLVAFVSNSHQQTHINTPQQPQPFRYAKSASENRNNVVSITLPATNHQRNHGTDAADEIAPTASPANQRSLATVTSQVRHSEMRSIEFSLRELQNLLSELMAVETRSYNGTPIQKRSIDVRSFIADLLFDGKLFNRIQRFAEKFILPTAALKSLMPTDARFFLFKGKFIMKRGIRYKTYDFFMSQ